MAQFDLRLRYKSPLAKASSRVLALTFPIWGLALPLLLALFIALLLRLPANIPLTIGLGTIATIFGVLVLFWSVAVLCDDDKIRISKDGICFPLKFLPSLQWKRQFKWDELKTLKLDWARQEKPALSDQISLIFSNGGVAQLKIMNCNLHELEQFLIAFEACADSCDRDAELADFESSLQMKRTGDVLSYTELWDKALTDRFSGVTFMPLEPDAKLQSGRYTVVKQLAFGGFSAVYLARSSDLPFLVLKELTLPQDVDLEAKATEMFKREAKLLSTLAHEQIARLNDYFVENGRHYLVLEYVEGNTLSRLVKQGGPLSAEATKLIGKQCAEILVFLHGQAPPIVHRDFTPDNLILTPDGRVKLIDFGAAKEILSGCTGTVVGKQSYMAPEQFKGKPVEVSDIYSLGATLAFLLTGKNIEPLSQVTIATTDTELMSVIFDCTALEPDVRPTAADVLKRLDVVNSGTTGNGAPVLAEKSGGSSR